LLYNYELNKKTSTYLVSVIH